MEDSYGVTVSRRYLLDCVSQRKAPLNYASASTTLGKESGYTFSGLSASYHVPVKVEG
jgi:hypothetical protein